MEQIIKAEIRTVVCIVLMVCTSAQVSAQFGDPGFLLTFGVGPGYSAHADSYELVEQFRVREYPGFRIFIVESKLGWTFSEQTAVYISGYVSPGATTISPYRSYYGGIGISQSLDAASSFYLKGGVGYTNSGIEKGESVGSGILTNLGVGFKVSKKLYLDINTYFGKMDEENYLDPNPFNSWELQINLILHYAIF